MTKRLLLKKFYFLENGAENQYENPKVPKRTMVPRAIMGGLKGGRSGLG